MNERTKFWQLIIIGCILCLSASIAVAEEPYRFVLAYGP